jgi:predicted XRE-type DNA-binding protein
MKHLKKFKSDYAEFVSNPKRKKLVDKAYQEIEGSGNVFADLGLEDAEELQVKSGLTRQIFNRIKELKLTQVKAASILAVSQPDVSKLMHCRYTGFSIERLIHLLNKLSVDVDITLRPRSKSSKSPGIIRLIGGIDEVRAA